uniref:Alternative protein NQO1 n=1 Tax=Homo sapiens TaxID=9606 RepID=L8EC59_HUMAN|nr:alternative protein NQO1 [Homo sapiens]
MITIMAYNQNPTGLKRPLRERCRKMLEKCSLKASTQFNSSF